MRELIYDNVRIRFLSEGRYFRLEVGHGGIFTDRNTLWIPDRGRLKGQEKAAGKSKADPGKSGAGSKAWW